MIKVTLEIDNAIPRPFSCLEALVKEILNSNCYLKDENTIVIPFSWDKKKTFYEIKIKKIEQI